MTPEPVHPIDDEEDLQLYYHERGWIDFWKGWANFDTPGNPPTGGFKALLKGLWLWLRYFIPREYVTPDDHIYLNPWGWKHGTLYNLLAKIAGATQKEVWIHAAGHTTTFGQHFHPLEAPPTGRNDLPHEPFHTGDIMLPGKYSWWRHTDQRGLEALWDQWHAEGRIHFMEEH